MNEYVQNIKAVFEAHRNPDYAGYMEAYMKNKFEFLGIRSPDRKELSKPFLIKSALLSSEQLWPVITQLWNLPEREFQYFAMVLTSKYHKVVELDWIDHYGHLISDKSWWDTVDFIAATLVGHYFKKFPEQVPLITDRWMQSGNIWLQRSCLLFQLKYKNNTDTGLLSSYVIPLAVSKEFFIAKAIGWALREYSKTDPNWVLEFVDSHILQPLSKREAIRLIARK